MLTARTRHQVTTTVLLLGIWIAIAGQAVQDRWMRARFDDRGSESTEKAVLTAIALAAALGLGAAITAVVSKYQGQIR
ncbi:hypothetical protein [Saccharopolyspora spinosa]|uniref:Uncharacterized protein n=1 Tax=Saccharopolyspora spinosa TaxID=60894 RepID=A0A2N3Y7A9_SACSN|nr:hypothetical protein [Saccharopolyspora spinosa]PKW18761.1 hypothetical protein A8926_6889 [Saccharopolyspora spinosa]